MSMMSGLICGICHTGVGLGLQELTDHLRRYHYLLTSRKRRYQCCQEGCFYEFQLYSSLARHIRTCHPGLATPGEVPDEGEDNGGDDLGKTLKRDLDDQGGQGMAALEQDEDFNKEQDQDIPLPADNLGDEYFPKRTVPRLSIMAATMAVEMRSNSAVTGTKLSRTFDSLSRCVDVLTSDLKTEVKSVIREGNVDQDITSEARRKLSVENPFDKVDTIEQSVRLVKKKVRRRPNTSMFVE